ncbi:MAG: DUF1501 domain-containing protein [Armatimonadetes bacterium]|nr:DUF1501 domain-containing protein [Armatimonadota bacterium]
MLDIDVNREALCCDGVSRRDFLRVGSLSALGLTLPGLLEWERAQADAKQANKPKAKNVLLIYLGGGLTHHDTFDPKPSAPQEIRGKYGVIPTGISGIRFSDKMKEMAKITNLYALCRGQVVGSDHHETAAQWMLTGNYGVMQGGDYPSIGSIVNHETQPLNTLPPYVSIPRNHSFTWELGKAAWLGERFESFKAGSAGDKNWQVPNLSLLADVPQERLSRRQNMLKAIDGLAKRLDNSDAVTSMDTFYQRASQMIIAPEARQAFDLNKESDKTQERYGKDYWGRQALLARRLIEGGVRFVMLNQGGWDHHANIFPACDTSLPALDRSVSALLQDMSERGLLKDTLVAMYGDFGRTSKINKDSGRDHWGSAGVMIFAGAGVRGGQVISTTDERGEYVLDRPVRPPEVAATIYHALGINYEKLLYTPQSRPVPILPECEPIKELWT